LKKDGTQELSKENLNSDKPLTAPEERLSVAFVSKRRNYKGLSRNETCLLEEDQEKYQPLTKDCKIKKPTSLSGLTLNQAGLVITVTIKNFFQENMQKCNIRMILL
jgi:hypothetical protein